MGFSIVRMGMIEGLSQGVLLMSDHTGDSMAEAAKLWGKTVELVDPWAGMDQASDLSKLKAAVFGSPDFSPDLRVGFFVEMARTTEAARKSAVDRAKEAERECDELRKDLAALKGQLEDLRSVEPMAELQLVPETPATAESAPERSFAERLMAGQAAAEAKKNQPVYRYDGPIKESDLFRCDGGFLADPFVCLVTMVHDGRVYFTRESPVVFSLPEDEFRRVCMPIKDNRPVTGQAKRGEP